MYDKSVVLEALQRVEETLSTLLKGVSEISDLRELPHSPSGMLLFNGICMSIFSAGEEVKNLNKYSNEELLPLYPAIPWKKIIGLRNLLAHRYFEIEVGQIISILDNDIPPLLETIRQMRSDLEK